MAREKQVITVLAANIIRSRNLLENMQTLEKISAVSVGGRRWSARDTARELERWLTYRHDGDKIPLDADEWSRVYSRIEWVYHCPALRKSWTLGQVLKYLQKK